MGAPLPERHRLKSRLPVGQEGLWSVITRLDEAGPWAIPDVEGETNRSRNFAGNYVRALAKAGIAQVVGERRTKYGRPVKLYRLAQKPAAHPRLRYDGTATEKAALHQEQLWNAARQLKQFSVAELAFAASTDTAVPRRTAQWYVRHLVLAGLVTVAWKQGASHAHVYRVNPEAASKPAAPRVLRLHVVYDPNSGEVIFAAKSAQEIAP